MVHRIDDVGIGLTPDEAPERRACRWHRRRCEGPPRSPPRGPRRKCAPPTHCDRPQSAAGSRWRGRVDHWRPLPTCARHRKSRLWGRWHWRWTKRNGHLQSNAGFVQNRRIEFDAHCGQPTPPHHDLPHSVHLRKLLRQDRFGGIVRLALGQHRGSQRERREWERPPDWISSTEGLEGRLVGR